MTSAPISVPKPPRGPGGGPGSIGRRIYEILRDAIYETGDMVVLTGKTLVSAIRPHLRASGLKTTLFGAIIAIVCCYKGMTASGGAAAAGRAVN